MSINKPTLFAIAAGTLAIAGIAAVVTQQSPNQPQPQPQKFQTSLPDGPSETPTEEPASKTSEELAAESEAERLAQAAEAQRQAAAEQKAREDMINRTAETWQDLNTILENGSSMSDNSDDPLKTLDYVLAELKVLPVPHIDPELAALTQDIYRVLYDAYQVEANYRDRMEELGVNIVEAGQLGCDVARGSVEENQLGWCLGAGLLSGTLMAVDASEEAKQLEAEYNDRTAAITAEIAAFPERMEAMEAYLSEEYGIAAY